MVTGTEIMAAYQGLKAGFDILQGLNATVKGAAINEVKFTLGQHILNAQAALTAASAAQADAAKCIADLEQEIIRLKDWSAEKQSYELQHIGSGATAYVKKRGMEGGEAAHWLCANCYAGDQKAILQPRQSIDHNVYRCPKCSAELMVGQHATPENQRETMRSQQLGPGASCPRCKRAEFRIERSEPDRHLGAAGLNRRYYRCDSCGFDEQKVVD